MSNFADSRSVACNTALIGALIRTLARRGIIDPSDLLDDLDRRDIEKASPDVYEGIEFAKEIIRNITWVHDPKASK